MSLLERDHVAARAAHVGENRVRLRVVLVSVVRQVADGEGIFRGHSIVKPGEAKILANGLAGIPDRKGGPRGQAVHKQLGPIRSRPKGVGEWQHTRRQLGNDAITRIIWAGLGRTGD